MNFVEAMLIYGKRKEPGTVSFPIHMLNSSEVKQKIQSFLEQTSINYMKETEK